MISPTTLFRNYRSSDFKTTSSALTCVHRVQA